MLPSEDKRSALDAIEQLLAVVFFGLAVGILGGALLALGVLLLLDALGLY